jgi:hypothetical protein
MNIDKPKALRAAEDANKRFGQWMPQQWLEFFIEAYNAHDTTPFQPSRMDDLTRFGPGEQG